VEGLDSYQIESARMGIVKEFHNRKRRTNRTFSRNSIEECYISWFYSSRGPYYTTHGFAVKTFKTHGFAFVGFGFFDLRGISSLIKSIWEADAHWRGGEKPTSCCQNLLALCLFPSFTPSAGLSKCGGGGV
jgi:hypothetical protein